MGCAAADYDNDGRTDLFVTGYRCCALYHNEGARRSALGARREQAMPSPSAERRAPSAAFRDVTDAAGIRDPGWSTSAGFADVDGDGRLDLYVARYVRFDPRGIRFCDQAGVRTACGPTTYDPERGRLWHNEGGGRFRDVTEAAGLADAHGNALGVAFGDYDGDGRVDLAVANDQLPGDLFHNEGARRSALGARREQAMPSPSAERRAPSAAFRNVGVASGIAYNAAGQAYAGMGIDWGDVDRDGRPDLVVTTYQHQPRCLYRQDRTGLFTDVAMSAGIGRATINTLAFGTRFLDVDNDGWLDVVFANGHVVDNIQQAEANVTYRQASQLFRNKGAAEPGRFEEISARAGPDFTRPIVGRGLCAGDLDDDGRLDLLIVDAEGAPLLLRNEDPSGHHWLSLRLIGTRSNRDAIGARVTLTAGGQSQTRACFTDGSYMSASDPRVHFGLGTAPRADAIVIRWPAGGLTTLRGVPADQTITVREGAG
jgi:enediyne biosynthesis protein E4